MEFYVVRVPYSKTAVGPASYCIVPGLYILTVNRVKTVMTEFIHGVIVKLNIESSLYFQTVSMPIMKIHVMNLYVFRIKEGDHIVVSIPFLFVLVIVMVSVNFKSFYSDSMDSYTVKLSYQRLSTLPACFVFKFNYGCRITLKYCIASNQNTIRDNVCIWTF